MLDMIIEEKLPFTEFHFEDSSEFNETVLEAILNSHLRKSLRVLNLSNCIFLSLQGLLGLCSFENLSSLDVSGCELMTDGLVDTISKALTELQHINLSRCPIITDTGIQALATNRNAELLSFSCQSNQNITHVGMNDLFMKCDQLQRLDVRYCSNLTFIGVVVHVRDNRLQYIGRNLQYVQISSCPKLQYYSLCWMMTALPMLVEFSAENIPLMDDNIIRSVISSCPMLTKLHCNHSRRVTMDIFRYLGQVYRLQLEELRLARISSNNPYQSQSHHTGDNQSVVITHELALSSPFYGYFHNFLQKISDTQQGNLRELDLSGNRFIYDPCFQLGNTIKKSESYRSIIFSAHPAVPAIITSNLKLHCDISLPPSPRQGFATTTISFRNFLP